jgi:triosephosphate isomerase
MRRPIVAANFKMHMTAAETAAYAQALSGALARVADVEVVVAPPFTALERAALAFRGGPVRLAAQNVNAAAKGAFTGEISVAMLIEHGCAYAIVGHSERRNLYGETDEMVSAKAAALLAGGVRPIVCVGESLAEHEADRSLEVVERQLRGSLAGVPDGRAEDVVVAYEPVWAIGTGRTATPELAQEVHQAIRGRLEAAYGDAAQRMRIQYGGSVKPDNAEQLMAQPDIDGALVGGASLDPASFAGIVRAASNR